jgi:hypothetical protein
MTQGPQRGWAEKNWKGTRRIDRGYRMDLEVRGHSEASDMAIPHPGLCAGGKGSLLPVVDDPPLLQFHSTITFRVVALYT